MEENKQLKKKENKDLKERLTKIELAQLGNNVIISGMQEQCWESYSTTKDRVYDTIVRQWEVVIQQWHWKRQEKLK